MTADDTTRPGFSFKRWSQRKLEAARAVAPRTEPPAAPAVAPAASAPASTTGAQVPDPVVPRPELPPPESLTFDSDFAAFLQPKVDESLKRQALKRLFSDPRFNVMDGLDVYIDDYSRPDPLPPGMLEQLVQGRYLFDPPRTRVNEHGVVEDVPPEDAAADAERARGTVVDGDAAPDAPVAPGDSQPRGSPAASEDPGPSDDATAEPDPAAPVATPQDPPSR
jgi:hypothetical protein